MSRGGDTVMIPFRRTSFPHHGKRGVFDPVTEVRYATHPSEMGTLSSDELRARFVVEGLFLR